MQRWVLKEGIKLVAVCGIVGTLMGGLMWTFNNTETAQASASSRLNSSVILNEINEIRVENGLNELQLDTELNEAASDKASHMNSNDYFAHTSPNGTEWNQFIVLQEDVQFPIGENLAHGYSDEAELVTAWMDSTEHRENILYADYGTTGLAIETGTLEGKSTTFVVQMFGGRK